MLRFFRVIAFAAMGFSLLLWGFNIATFVRPEEQTERTVMDWIKGFATISMSPLNWWCMAATVIVLTRIYQFQTYEEEGRK